jgi:hypothetical protein
MYITTFIRHKNGNPFIANGYNKCGPKSADHPSIGMECIICGEEFVMGDYTVIIPLGPGTDERARRKCSIKQYYNAVAIEVHFACAGGTNKKIETGVANDFQEDLELRIED